MNTAYRSTPAGRNVLLWDLGGERVFEVLAGTEVPWVLVDAAICVKVDPVLGTRAPLQYFWRYWIEFAAREGGAEASSGSESPPSGGAAETELDEPDELNREDGEGDDGGSACVTPPKSNVVSKVSGWVLF